MKRKLKVFIHVLKHSLFPFDAYYKKIRKTHFSFSLKYFFALIISLLTLSLLIKVISFVSLFPPQVLKTYVAKISQEYPNDLIISMNPNGRLSTNDDRPFILSSPLEDNPRPLLVIDPHADKEKIYDYDAFVLFSERRMYMQLDNSISDFPYELGQTFSFTKSKAKLITDNSQIILNSYWKIVFATVIFSILVGIPFMGISILMTLAIAAVMIFIVLKLTVKHKTIAYSSVLQICMHAFTGPLIIQCLAFIFGLSPSLPYWYTLVLWVFLAGAIYESYFEKDKSVI